MPHDFHLAVAKRIRSKWLDDCTVSGLEVKSRLVATDDFVACTPLLRVLRLVVSMAASKRKETRVLRCGGGVCTRTDR